jgi:hypothetical protein
MKDLDQDHGRGFGKPHCAEQNGGTTFADFAKNRNTLSEFMDATP